MQQWVRGDLQAPGIAAADVAGGNDQKPLLSTGGDQMEPRAGLGFGGFGFRVSERLQATWWGLHHASQSSAD